ncbi:hypothetical protein AB0N28_31755, partial [Streptomyces sp. NPDC051130]|uniref:hypothetical protein n=1 Tax=Streptomyces sp. NPDC051130 TaxID=3157223 RepID=UPI0034263CB7
MSTPSFAEIVLDTSSKRSWSSFFFASLTIASTKGCAISTPALSRELSASSTPFIALMIFCTSSRRERR